FGSGWNKSQTAIYLNGRNGGTPLFKVDLSNPLQPVTHPWTCSYSDNATCIDGQVVANAFAARPAWGNTEDYVMYHWSQHQLVKWDYTGTWANGAAPMRTVLFDPFAAGNCQEGQTPGYDEPMLLSSDDDYFWGGGGSTTAYTLYKQRAGCKSF